MSRHSCHFKKKRSHRSIWIIFSGILVLSALFTINTSARSNQRILIVSLAKSGSSALFFSIKENMPKHSYFGFDAGSLNKAAFIESRDVLTNVKFYRRGVEWLFDRHLDAFDKKIFLVRDPRDLLVSALVYKSAYMGFASDPNLREEFMTALIKKESNPKSVSVIDLYRLRDRLESQSKHQAAISKMMQNDQDPKYYDAAINFVENHKDFYIFRYEQFVDGDFELLNKYLGMQLQNDPNLGRWKNLARTKGYGNWKHWFTEEDVEYFKPILKPYMEYFGYNDEWVLDSSPVIQPIHCSEYFNKLISAYK